ncbi:MAG TPA: cupin domain-containing protein [Novosphingobium sp.]|nr:cupin domain-containing protein [Novosphingobium sp.]
MDAGSAHCTFVPAVGETRFLLVTFPPDSVMASPDFDPVAAAQETFEQAPDFASTFDPDCPGMHRTDTVDYGIVLKGEVWLEVDEGEQTRLQPGDIVVQTGTRHAWRNRTEEPATIAFVLIGAARKG